MKKMTKVAFPLGTSDVSLIVDFENGTLWASQKEIANLFGVKVPAVAKHIQNIFLEKELDKSVISKMEITATDGKSYQVDHYNLDMIISVGYRVNSAQATAFRQWATKTLREYATKGFVIDDQRFADAQLEAYAELVARVRAIRTSEKNFYLKIREIFSTAIDYNSGSEEAQRFFATVQNKFHFATHGYTAAELIIERADSNKIKMGLMATKGDRPTSKEAQTAKNYLTELEAKKLELLSEQFLSFAELRYMDKKPMTMADWETKLDGFLEFNDKLILKNAGTASREDMIMHVQKEIKKYKTKAVV